MADLDGNEAAMPVRIMGADIDGKETYPVQVDLIDGVRRLNTTGLVKIEELFGQDNLADAWVYIGTKEDTTGVGLAGDEIRIQIAAGDNPTLLPSIDLTYVITAGNVSADNPEIAVTESMAAFLNADAVFKVRWKAFRIKSNGILHISARQIGEIGERRTAGDFLVTATGTTVVTPAFDKIVLRGKGTALSRDPSDYRLGILGITGTVSASNEGLGRLFQSNPLFGGSPEMAVDGSVPGGIEFALPADATDDLFIDEIKFHGSGNGIQFGNFLNIAALTNGILVQVRSDDDLLDFSLIKLTEDFKNKFSTGVNWILEIVSGTDHFVAVFKPSSPFPIRKSGTFGTDDYIHVHINDDIDAISSLQMTVNGFKKEP